MESSAISYTHVSAFPRPHKTKEDHTLASSQLFISCNVLVAHQLDARPTPILLTSHLLRTQAISKTSLVVEEYGDSFFRFPCSSIAPDFDGENPISDMVSDVVPFPLENIRFRRPNQGTWTPLHSKEELVKGISEVAASLVGDNKLPSKEYCMHIAIERKVVLPRELYTAKVKAELEREVSAGLKEYLIQHQVAEGGRLSRSQLKRIALDELKKDGRMMPNPRFINAVLNQFETEMVERSRYTTHRSRRREREVSSSVENKLKKVKLDGEIVQEMGGAWKCCICRDGLGELGSCIARLPCNHMFHEDCISTWLGNTSNCPLCRQRLC